MLNKKIIYKKATVFVLTLMALFLFSASNVSAAPSSAVPNNFNVVINNVKKSDIKSVDVLYATKFSVAIDIPLYCNVNKNSSDAEFDKCVIDRVYGGRVDSDNYEWNNTKGGIWLNSARDGTIDSKYFYKYMIYENVSDFSYHFNTLSFSIRDINGHNHKEYADYVDGFRLRIVKSDGGVVMSNYFTKEYVVDENSTSSELAVADSVKNSDAFFGADFSTYSSTLNVLDSNFFLFRNIAFLMLLLVSGFIILFVFLKKRRSRKMENIVTKARIKS